MGDIIKDIGNNIQKLRLEKGLGIDEVAIECGLSANGLKNIEAGIGNPKIKTIERISKGLQVPITDILGLSLNENGLDWPVVLKNEMYRLENDDFSSLCDIIRAYTKAIVRKDQKYRGEL